MNEQIIIQDILKYLAECEYEGNPVSLETLAGELSISRDEIARIFRDLESSDLVEPGSFKLTLSGREYALHVLRAHRLYETYLARKTGVSDDQWHTIAHVKEHQLSVNDVDKLARDLNHPRYDPHGDPIPTATGEMPLKRGRPLTDYSMGWEGRVVHVEDDSLRLYASIAATSIAPGTVLRIAAKDARELQIFTEGCTFRFSTEAARQITVEPLVAGEQFDESLNRLSNLAEDEEASVEGLSPLCRDLERSRLLDLGLVPGTVVSVDLVSPAGNPIAYRIRGASIALRREQAERVRIRKMKEKTHE